MWTWVYILGGLIVWAVQFFTVYGASEIFLAGLVSRTITGVMTLICLVAAAALAAMGWWGRTAATDQIERWIHTIASMNGGIAFLAIAWQGIPALLIG